MHHKNPASTQIQTNCVGIGAIASLLLLKSAIIVNYYATNFEFYPSGGGIDIAKLSPGI